MSILIKGMEMPKHAGVCLIVANFDSCGSPVAMLVDRESILPKDVYDVIEVPTPHGRLIDADEYGANYIIDFDKSPLKVLESTPTIIEAEVSE